MLNLKEHERHKNVMTIFRTRKEVYINGRTVVNVKTPSGPKAYQHHHHFRMPSTILDRNPFGRSWLLSPPSVTGECCAPPLAGSATLALLCYFISSFVLPVVCLEFAKHSLRLLYAQLPVIACAFLHASQRETRKQNYTCNSLHRV